ncbi:zinc-dependent alcohol dehydrogenase family protein [Arenibacter sp. F20364]|uniref:zinc-dependent alcohol dehydrogenase family protein n=1 Tax=Arenibacter sp. F20364 TaxID=2926415 RepID=UPI001FF1E0A9|nr:zinc-dependent alcohol dehydrogenase family protein [Arenibacter sp. F20364]MCK0188398.1 zinc-dependent alcohol dehydrogenase family protein [Arenibacter sp. F20364]
MKAMLLNGISDLKENKFPLDLVDIPVPVPKDNQVRIKISVCGVCHTELDEIEGRIAAMEFPVVPGHQVIGIVDKLGSGTSKFKKGDRVGVAWIYSACGYCEFCLEGLENLCDQFLATGKDVNGGYAEYMVVPEKYAHKIPDFFSDTEAAPLLCAGAIGFRSVQLAKIKDGDNVGLTGFGASGHLVLKMLRYSFPKARIYVFARKEEERSFAKELGAIWAGDTSNACPEKLDSIIDTTPAWKPVVEALANLKKGGRLVINAIRKEEKDKSVLQNLNYQDHLWMEKEIKSVANLTARDVEDFLILAAKASIRPKVQVYPLEEANKALVELKERHIIGAKVLKIS